MKELDLKMLNSVIEFESKTDCSECVHNKVCGKKAEYLNIKEYFKNTLGDEADGDQVPFITLSIKCDYFKKEEPVFRKDITGTVTYFGPKDYTYAAPEPGTPEYEKVTRTNSTPCANTKLSGTAKKVRQILNEGK